MASAAADLEPTSSRTTPVPDALVDADIDGLLAGLGSDDFNDFDGLDDFAVGVLSPAEARASTKRARSRSPSRSPDPYGRQLHEDCAHLPEDDDPFFAPVPADIPAVVSFSSAGGRTWAQPTAAAMSKAMKIIQEVEHDVAVDEGLPKRRRIEPPTSFPMPSSFPPPSTPAPARSGFANAGAAPASALGPRPTQTSGFQLGSGSTAPQMATSRARALALFGEEEATPTAGPSTGGFQSGSGRAVAAPSSQSMARALAIFNDLEETGPSSTPIRRPSSPQPFSTQRPQSDFSTPVRQTGSRVPLSSKTNLPNGFRTPASTKLPKRIEIGTPGVTPRRIGLGGTPGGKPVRKGFVTPFRVPGAATATQAKTSLSALRTPLKPPPEPKKIYESVFNLEPPGNRKTWRELYLYPGFYSPGELVMHGLPDEIWTLGINNAIYYQFIAQDASVLGNVQAFERLKYEKCEFVTQKWVNNHWRLILWKVAGQIMAKPALYEEKWNWYEVLCQLKYRYEREFGAAQRSIVRRIQEHDSSPSLPMILCVSGIHHPPPAANDDGEPVKQRPYLVLTDGWYEIRAATDDCLARAILKGKIKIGRKLGISGARLDSSSDGSDVLEAFEKSNLTLTGNSTHLAAWDARLGLQPQPFVAGLSSLSVDGGVIVLMDVVLDRVYPLAFMNADKGSREAPWSEDEEAMRADQWKEKYESERTRLMDEMRKSLEQLEELARHLASHAEDVNTRVSDEPPDSLDDDFDELMEARDVMGRIRKLSGSHIVHLARHAQKRMEQAMMEEQAELEAKLKESCPPRDIRDFRMVRFSDAREGRKEKARTGMLNVWDARGLDLVEGKRFLVSNLIPGRSGDWSAPRRDSIREVYLHTRRDTRWKAV
ncbi:Breast cancer type 2 susceptibility [Vanrija pseudolonga]|uniref:Breast cancer type 2 susceptibility n=1 Tax=Vanrija pseudolonga TaxID=143232 RepID=A0AAF1BJS8_9TREE|nr:Breast cancer type 2 susceptibility [Vanrija pseudolonga]